tara:strand:+ start:1723 stop:2022 length:300 start_codon:yes stop_codon:yes gene_type:complete
MQEDKKYNGYTNYATWRVNLEILGDMEWDEPTSAEALQDLVEEIVFEGSDINTLQSGYANAFLSDVNYYELANTINEDLQENNPESGLVDALIMLASND